MPWQMANLTLIAALVCVLLISVGGEGASGQTASPAPAPPAAPPAGPKWTVVPASGPAWKADAPILHRTVDLKVGELQEVVLPGGAKAAVKLLSIETQKDDLRQAVRCALVKVQINGREATLSSAMYNLPQAAGGVQADCTVVGEMKANSRGNPWGLDADVRIRLWPAGSPWIEPNSFGYPVRQRWFAGPTQMANEPTYVDGVESPTDKKIYYHYGLDFGGAEGLIDVLSATDGLVVSAGDQWLAGYQDTPSQPRYDTVYVLDARGWFHRYSHLISIDPSAKVGRTVKRGDKLGTLGKEGDSGGWSHLHYQITARMPSGKWGIEEGYAFMWQAYLAEQKPKVIAVARPHALASAGGTIELDGSKSWSAAGKIEKYEWTFTDGSTPGAGPADSSAAAGDKTGKTASGAKATRKYDKPGQYCETLKVTDSAGNVDYDFTIVQIIDKDKPKETPPGIHLAYAPTMGLRPAQEITFKVRTFGTTFGQETVDFGDGTEPVKVKSDGAVDEMAKDGYAVFKHAFAKAGLYVVTARRANERGQEGVTRVLGVVENP